MGIGEAIATSLVEQGTNLILVSRSEVATDILNGDRKRSIN